MAEGKYIPKSKRLVEEKKEAPKILISENWNLLGFNYNNPFLFNVQLKNHMLTIMDIIDHITMKYDKEYDKFPSIISVSPRTEEFFRELPMYNPATKYLAERYIVRVHNMQKDDIIRIHDGKLSNGRVAELTITL